MNRPATHLVEVKAGADLAGRVRLHPGLPRPNIESTRPEVADRLSRGRRPEELPALLGAVFTLCSHAHRFTAAGAVAMALGRPDPVTPADVLQLRLTTLRDQMLRIAHDWPAQLPGAPRSADPTLLLRACPLWRRELGPVEQIEALPYWLEHKWLGLSVDDWLARHEREPEDWAAAWSAAGATPIARLLASQHEAARDLPTAVRPLALLDDADSAMSKLAQAIAADATFCSQPQWLGEVSDTGPWTRSADPLRGTVHNAWMRLVSRLIDVLRLARRGGDEWLQHGAMAPARGEGIAWTEMARGLLVHWVRVDRSGETPRIEVCRVLAPTEWNFHPQGVLAEALEGLAAWAPPQRDAAARRLAVAFDPCVAFDIAPSPGAAPGSRRERADSMWAGAGHA